MTWNALAYSSRARPGTRNVLSAPALSTLQQRDRLVTIYEQMPEPKFVIAVGTCACSAGVFEGCYCVEGGIDTPFP
jgi:Ni,Fe-hydrogenase III small subunit